jgi:hypothetical protein
MDPLALWIAEAVAELSDIDSKDSCGTTHERALTFAQTRAVACQEAGGCFFSSRLQALERFISEVPTNQTVWH